MKGLKGCLMILLVVFCGFCFFGCDLGGEAEAPRQATETEMAEAIKAFADYDGPRGMVRFSVGDDSSRLRSVGDLGDWAIHIVQEGREDSFFIGSEAGSVSIPIGEAEIYLTAEPWYESDRKLLYIRQNSVEAIEFTMVPRGGFGNVEIDAEVFDRNITPSITKIEKDFGYNPNITKYIWVGETLPEGVRLGDRIHVVFDSRQETGEGRRIDAEGIIEVEAFQYFALVDWGQNAPERRGSLDFVDVYVKSNELSPSLTLSPSPIVPLSCAVVAGTSGKFFLNFNLTAGLEEDIKVLQIPIIRGGVSQDTDVGNLQLFCDDTQVANDASLVGSRAIFPIGLVIPKGTTKEIILPAGIHPAAGIGNTIFFSVNPAEIVAVGVASGKAIVVSGTEVRGNPMQVVAGGELVCSSNPDQILGVIQGGESGGFFSTTLRGKLKMLATMEDMQCTAYNIAVGYEGTNEGSDGWFVASVRVDGRSTYLNSGGGKIFSDTFVGKDQITEVDVEADVVFYDRDILPEIAIRIEVVPEATGLASSRGLTQENGGIAGEFTAIYARGFLSRDVLQVSCDGQQQNLRALGINDFGPISFYSKRDIRINKIIIAVEFEKGIEFMEINIVDPRGFSYSGSQNVDWDVNMDFIVGSGSVAELFLRAVILNENPERHSSVKLTIVSIVAIDAASGDPVHVNGLPMEFAATLY